MPNGAAESLYRLTSVQVCFVLVYLSKRKRSLSFQFTNWIEVRVWMPLQRIHLSDFPSILRSYKCSQICAVNSIPKPHWKSHFWGISLLLSNKSLPHLNPVHKLHFLKNLLFIYSFRLACLKKTCLHQNHNYVLLLERTGFWRPIIPHVWTWITSQYKWLQYSETSEQTLLSIFLVYLSFFGVQILCKLLLVYIRNCTEIITCTFLFEHLKL